jgi:hypothetical protein
MGNTRSFKRKCAAATSLIMMPVLGSPVGVVRGYSPAPKIPSVIDGCPATSVVMSASGFTINEAGVLAAGLNSWNSYRGRSGNFLLSSGSGTSVSYIKRAPGTKYETACLPGGGLEIRMADDFGSALWTHAAYHEPGHTHLGFMHDGGRDDLPTSGTSGEPLMRGCFGTPQIQAKDDWARVSYRWESAITANSGFENPGMWSGTFQRQSGHGFQGTYDAGVSAGNTIQSATRVSPPLAYGSRARVMYKSNAGASSTFKMNYRTVDYPSGITCGGPYSPDTLQWNSPTVGAWVSGVNEALPSTFGAWTSVNRAIPALPAADGMDYNVVLSSTTDWLFIDNAEVTV